LFLKIKLRVSEKKDEILYKLGFFQKYFGHNLKIKSKKLKKILDFFFLNILKKRNIDLKKDMKKLARKPIKSKKLFFIIIFLSIFLVFFILYIDIIKYLQKYQILLIYIHYKKK